MKRFSVVIDFGFSPFSTAGFLVGIYVRFTQPQVVVHKFASIAHNCYTKFGGYHSQNLLGGGVSRMKLAPDFHYAFLAPTPESSWQKTLVHRDEHSALFALLAQPDAFSLLVYLQTRSFPFTVKFLEKHIGIPEARLEQLLSDFLRLELIDARTLSLDDADTKVYVARPNPAVIPLLAFAQEVAKRPKAFSFTSRLNGAIF